MNQENNPNNNSNIKKPATNKPSAEGLNLKEYTNLIPKTIAEIAVIQERGRKLYVKKKYARRDPNAIQKPKVKTKEELRLEAIQRQKDIKEYSKSIGYSNYYFDDEHEYRHVVLPKILAQWLPHKGLLQESEWTSLGVSQSSGWEHYMVYAPEPHILLFRREKDYLRKHGLLNQEAPETKDVNVKEETLTASDGVPSVIATEEEPVTSEIAPVKPIAYTRATRSKASNIDNIQK